MDYTVLEPASTHDAIKVGVRPRLYVDDISRTMHLVYPICGLSGNLWYLKTVLK